MRFMAPPWSSRRWSCCCAANSRRSRNSFATPRVHTESAVSQVSRFCMPHCSAPRPAWSRMVAAVGLLAALAWPQTGAAEGALAIGLPGDVAKEGVAIGWVHQLGQRAGRPTERALRGCMDFKDAPANTRALCRVIKTFRGECVAIALDPESGTPGWAGPSRSACRQPRRMRSAAAPPRPVRRVSSSAGSRCCAATANKAWRFFASARRMCPAMTCFDKLSTGAAVADVPVAIPYWSDARRPRPPDCRRRRGRRCAPCWWCRASPAARRRR